MCAMASAVCVWVWDVGTGQLTLSGLSCARATTHRQSSRAAVLGPAGSARVCCIPGPWEQPLLVSQVTAQFPPNSQTPTPTLHADVDLSSRPRAVRRRGRPHCTLYTPACTRAVRGQHPHSSLPHSSLPHSSLLTPSLHDAGDAEARAHCACEGGLG